MTDMTDDEFIKSVREDISETDLVNGPAVALATLNEALDRLEALVKANEELADQAFSAGWYGKTHELGILTAFEAFKDGGYKYRAVVDFAAADAAKKEGGK